MNKLISMALALMLVLGLAACGSSEKADDNALQAGFARVACLPDDEIVYIEGGDARNDPSTDGVLDELAETCIALKQGGQIYLIYTCDVVDIESFYTTTEIAITEKTGVPAENIIINATHTHSAPTLKTNLPGKDAYLLKYNKACAEAGEKAIADLSPATLSYGKVQTENMVRIRHYWMNDGTSYGNGHGSTASGYKSHMYPADEECQVLKFTRAAEDKKDIIMMNLGAHSTMASSTNTSSLSADFPGYARSYIESQADVHCAYFIAAAGDAVPSSRISGEIPNGKNLNAYGEQLGNYVLDCLENNMTESAGSEVKLYTERYVANSCRVGLDDPERLAQAQEIMGLISANGGDRSAPAVKAKLSEYGFNNYYEASGLVNRSNRAPTGDLPVTAMTVGDVGIVFASYEMFSEHGMLLKEQSPMAQTFIITCSEEDKAYIPSDIAFEHKFYETFVTRYAPGTGVALCERYCEILTALQSGTEVPAAQPAPK